MAPRHQLSLQQPLNPEGLTQTQSQPTEYNRFRDFTVLYGRPKMTD